MKRLLFALAAVILVGSVLSPEFRNGVELAWGQSWPRPSETRPVTQGGDWTLSHIGAVVHVAIVSGASGGPLSTNVAHISGVTHVTGQVRGHYSGAVRAYQVSQCGGTAATAVVTNTDRRDLIVKNIGTTANNTIWVGFGTTGHVALTAANGWALTQHEGTAGNSSQLILENYQGPLSCISTAAGMTLGVIEVLR